MLKRSNLYLLLIIVLAVLLRLVGIQHDFPYIFHPDEPTIVRSALGIRFAINPGHFDWPHLYVYINYFIFMGFAFLRDNLVLLGLKDFIAGLAPIVWNDKLIFYLISRILTGIIGGLTVLPIYLTTKRLFGKGPALISALLFAFAPMHIRNSHRALPDAPMLFLMSWGVYFTARIISDLDPSSYGKAGLLIGLSASTKYNGILAAIGVPLAHLLRIIKHRRLGYGEKEAFVSVRGVWVLVMSGLYAVLGFVIGTPFSVLDYKTFLLTDSPYGALWQFSNVGSVTFMVHLAQIPFEIFVRLMSDLGYTPLIIYFIYLVVLVIKFYRRNYSKQDFASVLLYIPSLLFMYYVTGFAKNRSQYYFILYPYLYTMVGFAVYEIAQFISLKRKFLEIVFYCLVLLPPAVLSLGEAYIFYQGDTRNLLMNWVNKNIRKETVIYSGVDLNSIFSDTSYNAYKLGTDPRQMQLKGDYYIASDGVKPLYPIQPLFSISNKLHLGPTIYVYTYQK
jgi:hypothetical protein